MQALDAITLKHYAVELNGLLVGAKINKVQHPAADEFIITVWGGGDANDKNNHRDGQNTLYINLNPRFSFCTLIHNAEKNDLIVTTLPRPTSFCMLLRKHLGNAKITAVEAIPAERILNITFENFNELGNKVILVLSLELMGKHSNMILYDDVQQVILGVAHAVGEHQSQHRELTAGLDYALPPKPPEKKPLAAISKEAFIQQVNRAPDGELVNTLNKTIAGLGKRVVDDVLTLCKEPSNIYQRLADLETGVNLQPQHTADYKQFSLLPVKNDNIVWKKHSSVHNLVRSYFLHHVTQTRIQQLQDKLSNAVKKQQKKHGKREEEVTPLDKAAIQELQNQGDFIIAAYSAGQLPEHPKGGKVDVPDYNTGQTITLTIDPTLSWPDNAELYYRRAKKARTKQTLHMELQQQFEQTNQYYDELLCLIEQADDLQSLTDIQADLENAGFLKPTITLGKQKSNTKKSSQKDQTGITSYTASNGMTLYIGKSSEGNNTLVGKLARAEDVWLHVHEMPGSHVLIKTDKQPVPDNTLLEAANLAVYYSRARQSKNVPVIYTQAKYVKKIPDSYPGHVNYKNEQTVFITVDEPLLKTLGVTIEV